MATHNTPKGKTPTTSPIELHACMGLNACKGHDVFGDNSCAGRGWCATQVHYCHTTNDCRGQGGCGLFGTTEEQCRPGENDCAWQGSCGTPIPASRFVTQGPNKGQSVWQLARKLFEARMEKAGRNAGPAPQEYGPTLDFLKTIGRGESCGFSGSKYCSYISKEAAAERHITFVKESAAHIDKTVENCKDCDC